MLSLHKDLWDWEFVDVSSDVYNLNLSLVDSGNRFVDFLNSSISKVQRRSAGVKFNSVDSIDELVFVPSQYFNLVKLHLRKPLNSISDEVFSDKRVRILNCDIVDVFFKKKSSTVWEIFIKIEGRYVYGGK